MTNDEPLMDDDALGDAMVRYFDEHPELVSDMQPTRDLWPDIEGRIQARVLPLPTSATSEVHVGAKIIPMRASRRRFAWFPMTAAAAALVVATAGVTYVLTRRAAMPSVTTPAVATAPRSVQSGAPSTTPATTNPSANATTDDGSRVASNVPASGSDVTSSRTNTVRDRAPRANVQLASRAEPTERDEIRADYDRDITTLRAALDARRTQLDPATVRTVEQNLNVIDNAIRQAKAALAKDPRSRFLNDQLDRSLAKKTDLLRAAALLPSA